LKQTAQVGRKTAKAVTWSSPAYIHRWSTKHEL